MKRLLALLFLLFPLAFVIAQEEEGTESYPLAEGKIEAYDLRLEHLSEPKGIDELKPRFSWKLRCVEESEDGVQHNGQLQSAYRIAVYKTKRISPTVSEPAETVWDSGKVEGNSQFVEYAGKPLAPRSEYTWTVIVWDKPVELLDTDPKTAKATRPLVTGKPSEAAVSTFSTGIWATDTEPNPWKGKWIGLDKFSLEEQDGDKPGISLDGAAWIWTGENAEKAAPVGKACFRKVFELAEPLAVGAAELALAADNGYTAFLNGEKLGGGSSFKSAQVFDVARHLVPGKNALTVTADNHGDAPNPAGLIGVLRIEYSDGKVAEIKTDSTWLAMDGLPAEHGGDWKDAVKIADLGKGPWGEIAVAVPRKSPPARYLRKEFKTDKSGKELARATVYISGLGYYDVSVNGRPLGDHVLDPVLTDYDKRVPYITYDIPIDRLHPPTANLPGNEKLAAAIVHVVDVTLGNGRYFAPRLTDPTTTRTFGYPKLMFQLDLQYKDGSVQTVVSDDDWTLLTDGPIRDNNDYDGEIYDARRLATDVKHNFVKAQIVDAPKGKLVAQMMPPMRVVEEFKPLSVTEVKPGVWVFDFGVNLVGNCSMRIPKGLPEGTQLMLRHAETLQHDGSDKGMLYVANLRGAKCRDIYIASGKETDKSLYVPTFSYHGFRYAELTGLPEGVKPTGETLTARAINTDLPSVGKFETSNETINAVFRCIRRGTQGNYLSIPTDCPQRDERQGWQGDRAGESKGEMFMFDNVSLYSKWLVDIEDSQRDDGNLSDVCPNFWPLYSSNVTWPSAFTIIPDSIWTMYGDRRPIERHYEAMKRWLIGHLGPFVKDGIIERDNYGDWCVPPEKPELIHSLDPARKTSKAILATSYYIYNLDLLTKYAKMLGKEDEALGFLEKAIGMRKAFNDKFLDKTTGRYDNGTQTSCVLPLRFNIVPKESKDKVFAILIGNIDKVTNHHIGTGLIGGQWVNRVLSDNGRPDIPYRFATNKDYPSWGFMVENGATTIWELWNGNTADPAMNSGNHVMLVGDLGIWYYEYLAGIKADPDKPGFEHIIMRPRVVGDLKFVDAEYNSVRGPIKSRWTREGDKFRWEIEIPVGSTATVFVPDGQHLENVSSGKHVFESTSLLDCVDSPTMFR